MAKKPFRFYWEEKPEEINIAAPGFSRDEIKVSIDKGFINISAEKKGRKVEKRKGFYKEEAFQKEFRRSMSLPENVKADELEVKVEDGSVKIKRKKRKQA
ncbi:MAG: Hsp20/alpha crystallin family protein [Candidatus Aenigmarchaeota archaeon]|nr:Hsp20/alpha crystallin family protein [Candidatus Aenigmarchaeota archaeon]